MTNTLIEQARKAAEANKLKNQAVDTGPDIKYEPPKAGPCVARFISYVEVGKQEPRKKGKFYKGPQETAIIQFELRGKKHATEIETDGKKSIIYPIITETVTISNSAKSWFYKMLHAMDYGRGNVHMAMMLGEGFKLNILHNEVEKDGKKVVYANIRDEHGWKISAPVSEVEDPDSGEMVTKPLNVPEPVNPLRMMLWDSPTQEQWDSLFVDGTRTVKVDGKDVEQSKNWLQNMIVEGPAFKGSAIEVMLETGGGGLPDSPSTDPDDELMDEGDTGEDEGNSNVDPEPNDGSDPLAALDLDDE